MKNPELLCIAHRGASGYCAENTLAAIQKALELGAPCVELDVYFIDGQLLAFHDFRLERTSSGEGYIWDQSFEHLRSLDVGDGSRIPTLEEVCNLIDKQACINVEIVGENAVLPVAAQVAKLLDSGWGNETILVSSFRHKDLLKLKQIDKQINIGVLIGSLPIDNAWIAEELGAFSIHPAVEFIDKDFVEDAHRRNLKVYVYTVNHPDDIRRMSAIGVDGVFTDFPDRVLDEFPQGAKPYAWR